MTREEFIAGLREHADSQGMDLTDDMLMTANLIYDVIERWKAVGLSEREAFSELFAWLNDPIQVGDQAIPLHTASAAVEMLESLEGVDGDEAAAVREELRSLIDESLSSAHEIARLGLMSQRNGVWLRYG